MIRTKRDLTPKDLRIFDLRNERLIREPGTDVLLPPNRALAEKAKLIRNHTGLFYEIPENDNNALILFVVNGINSGFYCFDVILDCKYFLSALHILPTLCTSKILKNFTSTSTITNETNGDTIYPKTPVFVANGSAKIEIHVKDGDTMAVSIYSGSVKLKCVRSSHLQP